MPDDMMPPMQGYMPMQPYGTMQTGKPDYESILRLSRSNEELEELALSMLGVRKVKKGSEINFVRDRRPLFTYEAVYRIIEDLGTQINPITMRTIFGREQIRVFNEKYAFALAEWMSQNGIDSYVSHKAWKGVIDIYNMVQYDANNRQTNGWRIHGINWQPNDPFTDEMLEIVKIKYDLRKESCGQSATMHKCFVAIIYLIAGARNKSLDALMLMHESQTYKEVYNIDPNENKTRHTDSWLTKAKNSITGRISGMFGA